MIESLLLALEDLGQGSGVATYVPLYAPVSALHVIGIALLFGVLVPVQLTMTGVFAAFNERGLTLLWRIAALGVALCQVTCVLLFSTKLFEHAGNPVVLVKLVVVGAGVLHAVIFHVFTRANPPTRLAPARSGFLSLGLWLAAILLGRWIAFSM